MFDRYRGLLVAKQRAGRELAERRRVDADATTDCPQSSACATERRHASAEKRNGGCQRACSALQSTAWKRLTSHEHSSPLSLPRGDRRQRSTNRPADQLSCRECGEVRFQHRASRQAHLASRVEPEEGVRGRDGKGSAVDRGEGAFQRTPVAAHRRCRRASLRRSPL